MKPLSWFKLVAILSAFFFNSPRVAYTDWTVDNGSPHTVKAKEKNRGKTHEVKSKAKTSVKSTGTSHTITVTANFGLKVTVDVKDGKTIYVDRKGGKWNVHVK